jgi:5-methylcytosine-specific restriction enzyme A
MPIKPPTFRGPGQKIWDGNERARKAQFDRTRPSSTERGYDQAWRKVRARFLERNPICAALGCTELATEVDHIYSIRERPELRLAEFNLRPSCKRHHSERTAREQGFARVGGVQCC